MHTVGVIFGVIADILLALAVLSIIVGLVWIAFPLKYKVYTGIGDAYRDAMPLGGRETGFMILASGIAGLLLGFLLDKAHVKLLRSFGART